MRDQDQTTKPRDAFARAVPAIIFGASCITLSIAVSTETWVGWFAHPVRVDRLGSLPPETIRGAELLGITALVAGVAWILLPFIERLTRTTVSNAATSRPSALDRRTLVALLALVALAAVPRLLRIGESLWFDEIAALLSSSAHGVGPALGNFHTLANHVLHSAVVAWVVEGGADEISIRTPALLAGLLSDPAMYLLGRSADDERLGWIAAAILAFMPIAVLESVESRGYGFMILFAILSTHQWLRMREDGPWSIEAYAVFTTLGCWSHLVFVVVPIGHAVASVAMAVRDREDRSALRRTFVAELLAAATTLMVLSPILPDLLRQRSEFIALDGDEPSWFGPEGWHAVLGLGGSWTWWSALPGLILAGFGTTEILRWPRLRSAVLAGVAGGIVILIVTFGAQSWIYARFMVFMVVPTSLLIAAALRGIGDFEHRGILGPIVALLLFATWTTSVLALPPKQPIREAVIELRALAGPDASAWSVGLPEDVAAFYTLGEGPRLMRTGLLGSDLDARSLAVGPDHLLMLYPSRVSAEVLDLLRDAGFTIHREYEGWLDWTHGDVAVWTRAVD